MMDLEKMALNLIIKDNPINTVSRTITGLL
jgi:hypothetical protein